MSTFPEHALRRAALALVLSVPIAGCGLSFPIGSFGKDDGAAPSITTASLTTGSIATAAIVPKAASPLSPEMSGEDWRRARSALSVALDPIGNGSSARWDNPESGMGGSFTPVGQPFVKADEICRVFVADISGKNVDSTLQGTACRFSGHDWAIRDLTPWRKPA